MAEPTIDHCAKAAQLRAILEAIATGDALQMARFGEDEARYFQADKAELKSLIAYHEGECIKLNGGTPRRRRFAAVGRYRPY